jgi:hypothetical protein
MDSRTLGRIAALEQRVRGIPSRFAGGAAPTPHRVLSLIGGNLLYGGVQGLKYAADPFTPSQVWDPDVDDVMDTGLGRAALYVDGLLSAGYVLIRHNMAAWPGPLVTGQVVKAVGEVTITYTPGVGDPIPMTCYTFAPWTP